MNPRTTTVAPPDEADTNGGYMPEGDGADDDIIEGEEVGPATPADPTTDLAGLWEKGGDTQGLVGMALIQALVKRLPNRPGVYRMISAAGDVLYVGKARSLKKRVTNYALGRAHTARIGRMIRETASM